MGAKLFYAEGQTDMTELTVAFRHFVKAPKKWSLTKQVTHARNSSRYQTNILGLYNQEAQNYLLCTPVKRYVFIS